MVRTWRVQITVDVPAQHATQSAAALNDRLSPWHRLSIATIAHNRIGITATTLAMSHRQALAVGDYLTGAIRSTLAQLDYAHVEIDVRPVDAA